MSPIIVIQAEPLVMGTWDAICHSHIASHRRRIAPIALHCRQQSRLVRHPLSTVVRQCQTVTTRYADDAAAAEYANVNCV